MLRTTSTLGAALILSVLGAAGACSSSKTPAHAAARTVTPTLLVLGKLHAQIAGDLVLGVQGSYYGCTDQDAGSSWVLDAPGAPPAYMENQTGLQLPSVLLSDSNCSLQIDDIVTDTDTYVSSAQPEPLYITGPNATAGEYLEGSIGFNDPARSDELAFYANAQSDFVQAEASFTLTLIVGDDPDIGTPSTTAEAGALPIAQTCADVLAGEPAAPDGNYTLYAGGSPGSPWIAYCYGMQGGNDGGAPLTYLTLGTGLQNFSQYTAGSSSPGTNVVTTYTRVNLDPVAMVIHGGDQRFASSTGSLLQGGVQSVTSMPYGVAMSCDGTPSGTGSIDLTGTNFAPGSFSLGGAAPDGGASAPYGGATEITAFDYTLQGGGSCGWITGQASAFNPFNTTDVTLNVVYLGNYGPQM